MVMVIANGLQILTVTILIWAIPDTHALTPDERCELCQVALRTVYAHFSGAVPSRRKLGHQLKHECKRHFNYRRRCLLAIKDKTDMIYRDMTGGDFKPIRPCTAIKECKSLHSPITDKFYREMNKELSQISTTTTDSTSESPTESSTITMLSSSTTSTDSEPSPSEDSEELANIPTDNPLSDVLSLSILSH